MNEIIKEAHKRFAADMERERDNRLLWVADVKFANGNSDNNWQWSQKAINKIGEDELITVNKVKKNNRQIINDSRQNQMAIVVRPVDDDADIETAKFIRGIIKNIEKVSTADTAYDIAAEFCVDGGLGYIKLETDYLDNKTNKQGIFIRAVLNPLNIVFGPFDKPDGSDCMHAFEFNEMTRDAFEEKYPGKIALDTNFDTEQNGWISEDTVRVANYYKVIETADKLYFTDTDTISKSDIDDPELIKQLEADPSVKSRKTKKRSVKCYKIAGDKIIDKDDWPGTYIPLIRMVGEEKVIDGEIFRSGNTRQMKDSQRMYNFELQSEIQFKANQTKTPWIAAIEGIQGPYLSRWDNSGDKDYSVLPYNHRDDAGNPIPPPFKPAPPMPSSAYLKGMEIAENDLQDTSGQFDAQFGDNVNQQSGRALNAVQNRGAVQTFHFEDNKARALKFLGTQIVELIPLIYDVEQVIRIIGEDDKEEHVEINPNQPKAIQEVQGQDGKIKKIFNPGVGSYDVDVQVGRAYGTLRQEAFTAMSDVAAKNPAFMQIAGDLYWKSSDMPYADKIAERYEKTLPPELKDQEEGQAQIPLEAQQQIQQLTQQLQQIDQVIQKMSVELEKKDIDKFDMAVKRYNAETDRLKLVAPALSPEQLQFVATQMMMDLNRTDSMPEQQQQPIIN